MRNLISKTYNFENFVTLDRNNTKQQYLLKTKQKTIQRGIQLFPRISIVQIENKLLKILAEEVLRHSKVHSIFLNSILSKLIPFFCLCNQLENRKPELNRQKIRQISKSKSKKRLRNPGKNLKLLSLSKVLERFL